jgi:pyruvate dehydrogenase E2 component (dihydrolipoamide acetyltransferase)
MNTITMPALSPMMEEGNLARWLVKPGDRVSPGQVIAEIETDKATMEVESVDEGVIAEILVAAGAQGVKVNTPIATLQAEAETPARESSKTAPVSLGSSVSVVHDERHSADAAPDLGQASPLARRLAARRGVDLASLTGSGPNGRVVRADVEAAARGNAVALAPPQSNEVQPAPTPLRSLEESGIRPGGYDLVAIDMMRKTIAKRMTASFRDVPHFPLSIDIEIDALLKARGEVNERFGSQGVKISVNDMCIKAAALALKLVPEANASYTPEGIAMHHHADIAVAVALPQGLITPIMWAAETKGLAQISAEMADLAQRARERKLKPEEFQGGTFSISNMGMFGVRSFASIINEPHGMIMSIGAGEKRAVVRQDALAVATVMSVTVTCDHRVVDGAIGAAFLKAFKSFLEDPMAMLL